MSNMEWSIKRVLVLFPIPMRGNEQAMPAPKTLPPLMFPIPMRGNETYSTHHEHQTPKVSDPHEG